MRLIHPMNLTRTQVGGSLHHFEVSLIISGRMTSFPKQHGRHFVVENRSLTSGSTEGHSQYTRLGFDLASAGVALQAVAGKRRIGLRNRMDDEE